jgi:hypothetical protein
MPAHDNAMLNAFQICNHHLWLQLIQRQRYPRRCVLLPIAGFDNSSRNARLSMLLIGRTPYISTKMNFVHLEA